MFDLARRESSYTNTYDPFRDMADYTKFSFNNPFGIFGIGDRRLFRTDITERPNEYMIESELPGFDKTDIHIELNGSRLKTRAEHSGESNSTNNDSRYICYERHCWAYERSFEVSGVDADKISTEYNNGILKLTLPKKQEYLKESKHIEIK